ncbi:MAG TPA: DNA polymerase III subunit delta' [Anaeromyxobacteraceae bacterium]|nr:DNA polymerase III subunit delta' [Anaeromyxobacteraceae bacterium]
MPFSELIGQDRALGHLRSALARGALHHAYLFGGPEGVGKATAARLLAQAGNCEAPEPERPCGACPPCRKIARSNHPDVLELAEERVMARQGRWEPRGGRTPSKDIVVDQIRDLVDHRLALRRFEGRRRFVVIDPADAMNPQAQNALLKSLEEPPDDTTFVLVASNPDLLLPTIRSRCARVAFAPLGERAIAGRLAEEEVAEEDALLAAALSGGSLARAREVAAQIARERKEDGVAMEGAVEDAARLDPDDAATWIAFAARHGKSRELARETCQLLLVWLRDVLAVLAAGEGAALALGRAAGSTRAAARALGPAAVARRVGLAGDAVEALKQNAAPALALERMLIGWFHGARG